MKAMLGALWLRVKGNPRGRNAGADSRPAPLPTTTPGADLAGLSADFERLEAALTSESASTTDLREHFKRFGTALARLHTVLNKSEARVSEELDYIRTTRKHLGDSKERLALVLARVNHIELVRTLFDDPESLEADLYVDHIERRTTEVTGPVPVPDFKQMLPGGDSTAAAPQPNAGATSKSPPDPGNNRHPK